MSCLDTPSGRAPTRTSALRTQSGYWNSTKRAPERPRCFGNISLLGGLVLFAPQRDRTDPHGQPEQNLRWRTKGRCWYLAGDYPLPIKFGIVLTTDPTYAVDRHVQDRHTPKPNHISVSLWQPKLSLRHTRLPVSFAARQLKIMRWIHTRILFSLSPGSMK